MRLIKNDATLLVESKISMPKWKCKIVEGQKHQGRGHAERYVKQHYESKGWIVFDSTWHGYRLIATDRFMNNRSLTEDEKKIIQSIKKSLNPDVIRSLKTLFCLRRGLPDFMLIDCNILNQMNDSEAKIKVRSPRFIEVKGPKDGLCSDQMRICQTLIKMGFKTTIFFVLFETKFSSSAPKISQRLKSHKSIMKIHPILLKQFSS